MVDIASFARIRPMVNQVETHPHNQQIEAKKWMDKYGVQIEAWAPFGEGRGGLFEIESLYKDAKDLIRCCGEIADRAEAAMREENSIIRIGSSPMTPAEVLVELWLKLHDIYPGLRFQLVPFENTPENARQILKNLGATAGCLVI